MSKWRSVNAAGPVPAQYAGPEADERLAALRAIAKETGATPNQVLIAIALFLSFFVMQPVLTDIYDTALSPYLDGQMDPEQAIALAWDKLSGFMVANTRQNDLLMFSELAGHEPYADPTQVPVSVLLPAYITSELKTAFQIGFLVFIPFLIIDLVVASVLMSMGMMMLSPLIISFPFKIMLFVLVDGWVLIIGTLASSFALST